MSEEIRSVEFQQLLTTYPALLKESERAVYEDLLWKRATREERRACRFKSSTWLRNIFGGRVSKHGIELRARLRAVGVQEIWDRVDGKKMTLGTAVGLVRAATKRTLLDQALSLADCVVAEISSYDAKSGRRTMPDGAAVHCATGADRVRSPSSVSPKRARKPTVKGDWARLRELVGQIVAEHSGDISEIHRLDLLARLEADVTSAIRSFEARVKSLRMAGDTTITRRQLAEACRLFNMPAPALGRAVDLQRAKLRRNQYVRHIHSDSGGSGDGAQMRVVVENYELLERYNMQKGIRHERKNAR